MNRITSIVIAVLLCIMSGCGSSSTERTLNTENEYGGKTIEYVYSPKAKQYKQGVERAIGYYNRNGKVVKSELFIIEGHPEAERVARMIIYYDENEKKAGSEVFDRNGNMLGTLPSRKP